MRAFGYVRISKDSEETTSPQRQREKIEKLCADRGYDLLETFEDIDQSAFNGHHRPQYERMLARLEDTDAIVFWRPERLARSVKAFSDLLDLCQSKDVALVSTDYKIDTSSAMGKAFVQITAVFAELESGTISERSRQMMAHKKKNGEWIGRRPFGWQIVGKHLEKDDEEQAIIRDAAERYIAGEESLNAIAKSHGMKASVLGTMLYSERVHDALPDLAGPLAEAILQRRFYRTHTLRPTLLGGIAECEMCGQKLVMRMALKNRKRFTMGCKQKGHVSIEGSWLDKYVTDAVLGWVDVRRDEFLAAKPKKRPAKRKVSAIEARIEFLVEQFTDGKITQANFKRSNERLQAQLKEAQESERSHGADLPAELARNLSERWLTFSVETQRRIVRAVCESIVVTKATNHGPIREERVVITWRGITER